MGETDRQTDRHGGWLPADPERRDAKWGFTAYEGQWHLFQTMPELVAEWGWQTEICPSTQREHYQGYFRLKRQARFAQVKKLFPGVNLYAAREWAALLKYCRKTDTAVPGSQVHEVSQSKAMSMADALIVLATHVPYTPPYTIYDDVTPKKLHERYENEFWCAVREVLTIDPQSVGLWTQPQYMRAWINLRTVYLDLAREKAEFDAFKN